MCRPSMLFMKAMISLSFIVAASGAPATLFPHIADTTHASSLVVTFFYDLFTAKSQHNATSWISFFNLNQVVFFDATLGEQLPVNIAFLSSITQTFAPNATAYPLQILGDTIGGAIVYSVDTPGLFGAEIRAISAYDFLDGKITREVDYWDGRQNSVANGRAPADEYPVGLGVENVTEKASPVMIATTRQLNAALSAGNATAASLMFTSDAVFRDLTLRTREEGELAIGRYLQRAIQLLPYGSGATLRHVLGSDQGGGYEWATTGQAVRNGITGLELDSCGLITKLTVVWDASQMSNTTIAELAALSIET